MRCAFGSRVRRTRTVVCATTCATSRPRCASTAGTAARAPRSRTAASDFPTASASGRSTRSQGVTTSSTENASTNSRDPSMESQGRGHKCDDSTVAWWRFSDVVLTSDGCRYFSIQFIGFFVSFLVSHLAEGFSLTRGYKVNWKTVTERQANGHDDGRTGKRAFF